MTDQQLTHKMMVLRAENTARSAACETMRHEIDILEEGLRQAKAEIARLKARLAAKTEFRHEPETAASRIEAN